MQVGERGEEEMGRQRTIEAGEEVEEGDKTYGAKIKKKGEGREGCRAAGRDERRFAGGNGQRGWMRGHAFIYKREREGRRRGGEDRRGARDALFLRRVLLLDDLDDFELGLCVGLCALLLLALDALDLVDRVEVRLGLAVRASGLGEGGGARKGARISC